MRLLKSPILDSAVSLVTKACSVAASPALPNNSYDKTDREHEARQVYETGRTSGW